MDATPTVCQRCRSPIVEGLAEVRLTAEGPRRREVLTICPDCRQSLSRWLLAGRPDTAADPIGARG